MHSTATTYCRCCRQPLHDVRAGARLTALKARIYDLIEKRPGIRREDLAWIIYGQATESRLLTLGSHVYQIREKLEIANSDRTIEGTAAYGLRIVRKKMKAR